VHDELTAIEKAARERAATNVAQGAALLDRELPGWWDVLDLTAFQIADADQCVIGQLAQYDMEKFYKAAGLALGCAGYAWGLTQLSQITADKPLTVYNVQRGWAYQHGFEVSADDLELEYPMLQEAWAEAVAMRRGTSLAALLEGFPDLITRTLPEDDDRNDDDDDDEDE
jgi:hypothetical protein